MADTTTWRVLPDARAVGDLAAARIVDAMADARAAGRAPVLGWPVGRSTRPVVGGWCERGGRVDDAHVVLMDDYLDASGARVPVSAPTSCQGMALRELVRPLADVLPAGHALRIESLHSPDPVDPAAYETLIESLGGIDLFVVAVGASDGHVALNPPGSPRTSRTRIVPVALSTRIDNLTTFGLGTLAEVPTHGITVGLDTIARARRLVVVAHGADKRATVRRLIGGHGFDPDLPASIVRDHPAVELLCDEAAAGW